MAEAVLFNIAEGILKNLGSRALDEIASAWGFKDRLQSLKTTMNTIKDVLLDAEERQLESHAIRSWLARLTTAVYSADDLFDEFATVASQRQFIHGNKLTKEVTTFFSSSNQIAFAFAMSRKIKKIRKELDDIVKDSTEFGFVLHPREERRVTSNQRDETYSFVDADDVIGRDGDKKAILDVLLDSDAQEHEICVVPIVGIGGMGKTTLAQLVYNDKQVEEHFELRLWVCVSENFDIKGITEKILMSARNTEIQKLEMEQLQGQLRKELGGKKYLLVLDDVWNEDRNEWLKLRSLLKIGRNGSKILVTTRSMEVAKIMDTVPPCELKGLSEEKSWDLFEKMAFEPGEALKKPHLVKVGKEIVKKCANVPLALRTLGSLLYGKNESKWLSFKDTSLAKISENQNDIMAILKLSYHHLWSPLKNCFAYCSLFPKDYKFDKETLTDLWMAEGFIIPTNESQSLKELAEEYFTILLQRCFFQDITRDEWGAIESCKMHDLMHDLAEEVAGAHSKVVKFEERNFSREIHHLSFAYSLTFVQKIPSCLPNLKLLRTFLLPQQFKDGSNFSKSICQQLVSSLRCLRVLDLHNLGIKSLPSCIGNLIHLRYLDLSHTPIKELPDSITEIQNLQTLKLYDCSSLKTLPINIRKLTNLRSLDLAVCPLLTHMPSGIGELTSLHKLPSFLVNYRSLHRPQKFKRTSTTAKLNDLKNLNNLIGLLRIEICKELKDPVFEAKETNLTNKQGLTELHIEFDPRSDEDNEAVLEGLKPHPNLRKLEIRWYKGQKLPAWATMDNLCITLPNLVEIVLVHCHNCQQVPTFGQLPFLKRLTLASLGSVDYIESVLLYDISSSSTSPPSMKELFFPSLQVLKLINMNNLKGWWKEVEASHPLGEQHLLSMSFSNLSKLRIEDCPNLIFLPLCPNVEDLTLLRTNETLMVLKTVTNFTGSAGGASSAAFDFSKLKTLSISNIEDLISLPEECLHQLSSLKVKYSNLQSTCKLEEVSKSLSSLRSLEFTQCYSLKSFSKGLEHLSAVEKLVIGYCDELDLLASEEVEDGMPWKAFRSLHSLTFVLMPKLLALPSGLQHLKNLRSLILSYNTELTQLPEWIGCFQSLEYMELECCYELESLPEGFCKLTTLNELQIIECPGLTKRCRGPTGIDWPKIQRIPLVTVRARRFD